MSEKLTDVFKVSLYIKLLKCKINDGLKTSKELLQFR